MNRLIRRYWFLPSLFLAAGTVCLAQGDDLIVESRSGGHNSGNYVEIEGKWMDSNIPPELAKSSAPGLSQVGTRKSAFSGPNITVIAPAAARFLPKFAKAGRYHVYATWPRGGNAIPVYYRIKHADGAMSTRKLAQDGWGVLKAGCNAGLWVPLGEYDFKGGDDEYVEVATEDDAVAIETRWYGQVYADAVRFSKRPLRDLGTQLHPQEPPLIAGQPSTSIANAPPVSHEPLDWSSNIDAAYKTAQNQKRKLLLFFTAKQSAITAHCEDMVFSNPAVKAALKEKYVLVKLDIDKERELANKLSVFRGGTINIYDGAGRGIAQIKESLTAREFLAKLNELP